MNESQRLIEAAITKGYFRSYRALAKAIGKDASYIRNIRREGGSLNDYGAAIIAQKMGAHELTFIARVNLDRARSSEERAYWLEQVKKGPVLSAHNIGYVK